MPILARRLNGRRRRRNVFFGRFRGFLLASRGRFGSRRFLSFLDQAANRIGRLRAFADPIFDSFNIQRAIVTGFFRIVRADDLDKFSVARTAPVRHYHFVVGPILRSFSA